MTTVSVYTPTHVAVPRAANLAANLFSRLIGAIQQNSESRAVNLAQAERAREAAAVRDYAQRYARHDPRFAADLMAAADRHEQT